jgi:hypothetical protein
MPIISSSVHTRSESDRSDILREVMIARDQWQPPENYDASVTVSDLVS